MASNKRKLSSYDKEILAPLKIMKWMLGIYIAVNLFVPLYSPMRIGAVRFYNYLNIIFHFIFQQILKLINSFNIRIILIRKYVYWIGFGQIFYRKYQQLIVII